MPDSHEANQPAQPLLSPLEFREFFATFFRWSVTEAPDHAFDLQRKYFREKYPDEAERHLKATRLMIALRYLTENLPSFDQGAIAVVGEQESLISPALLMVLWSFFANPSADMDNLPPPSIIAQMVADEQSKS